MKDETDWNVEHTADGTGALEWTSPSGRRHITEPATVIQAGIDDNLRRRVKKSSTGNHTVDGEGPPPF